MRCWKFESCFKR